MEALAVACGSQACIWRPRDDVNSCIQHFDQCRALQWNHNNKVLASGGKYGRLALHYHNGGLMGVLPKEDEGKRLSGINGLSFSKGSKLIALACEDATVQVWDLKTQSRRCAIQEHEDAVSSVSFSPNDQFLASAGVNGAVYLHEVQGGTLLQELCADNQPCKNFLHVSGLEPLIASAGEDGCVQVWDADHPVPAGVYKLHKAAVMGVYFSPASAAILVSAGLDARACLLDRRTQVDHVTEMSPGVGLSSVTCRDDGNCIALGTVAGDVLLYDPRRLDHVLVRKNFATPGQEVTALHWQNAPRKRTSTSASASNSQSLSSPSAMQRDQASAHAAAPQSTPDTWALSRQDLDMHQLTSHEEGGSMPSTSGMQNGHSSTTGQEHGQASDRQEDASHPVAAPSDPHQSSQPSWNSASELSLNVDLPDGRSHSVPSAASLDRQPSCEVMHGNEQPPPAGGYAKGLHLAPAGMAAHSQGHDSSGHGTEDRLLSLQEDLRRLHLEMIRQFTIHQVDFTDAIETVIQQQNSLSEQMKSLAKSVQALSLQRVSQAGSSKGSKGGML